MQSKKAVAAARAANVIAIADDSGLEIDALDGVPGIYSARFGGEHLSQSQKNTLILRQLHGIRERSARFRCIIAVAAPDGTTRTAEGVCEGVIGTEPRGQFGFGYDPLFFLPKYGKTMAELEPALKNTISHRARALTRLNKILPEFLCQVQ
jgi:XTP/dITP diphosphohydrolase